jgi:hypothetical protein
MCLGDRENLGGGKWLDQVGVYSKQPSLDPVKHSIAARDNHKQGLLKPGFGFEVPDDSIAVEPGQTEIDQDECGDTPFWSGKPPQGFYSIRKGFDLVACPVQADFQYFAYDE